MSTIILFIVLAKATPPPPNQSAVLLRDINTRREVKLKLDARLASAATVMNLHQVVYRKKYQRLANCTGEGLGPLGLARASGYRGRAAQMIVLSLHKDEWASMAMKTIIKWPHHHDKAFGPRWTRVGISAIFVPGKKPTWLVCIMLGE